MGNIYIWDTLVKMENTFSVTNKFSWTRVTTTGLIVSIGDLVIEERGAYYLHFHSAAHSPSFIICNNGTENIDFSSEIYSSVFSGEPYLYSSNYGNLTNSRTIIENTTDKIVFRLDASSSGIGYNVVDYIIRKDTHYVEILPATDKEMRQMLHSSPNRTVAAVSANDIDEDFTVDSYNDTNVWYIPGNTTTWYVYDVWFLNSTKYTALNPVYDPPGSKNSNVSPKSDKMLLYQTYDGRKNQMFVMLYSDPSNQKPQIWGVHQPYNMTGQNESENWRIHQILAHMNRDLNKHVYLGSIPFTNTFRIEPVNMLYNTGNIYTSTWNISNSTYINGKWRMVGRIRNGTILTQYTQNILDGNFSFIMPISGTLESVVMYLYDRTPSTPLININGTKIITPMELFRMISCPVPICHIDITSTE